MKKLIYGFLGLFVAASVEASREGDLHAVSAPDSHQSFCCEVKSVEKQSAIASETSFSLPEIAKCKKSHLESGLEKVELHSGCEIFFPSDGRQPTADEAVQWSCANAEDELVTDWYVSMFGLSDWEKTSLNMGFNTKNELCKIINFDPELDRDPTKAAESQAFKATFIANFRKIASVSVGRVLLYRLLLEIRRTDSTGNGCIDATLGKSLSKKQVTDRNNLRSITIKNADKNSFSSGGYIKFHNSKDQKETNVLGSEEKENVILISESRTDDVGLFHEMLHWFHSLRDPKRKGDELTTKVDDLSTVTMDDENLELWSSQNAEGKYIIKMEEFRTIMGYRIKVSKKDSEEILYDMQEPINGDDLCENLYRRCVGQKLRYGHSTKPNQTILKKVADHMRTTYENQLNSGGYKFIKS